MRPEDIDKNNISEQDEPSTNEAQETSSPANEGNEISEEHSEYKYQINHQTESRIIFPACTKAGFSTMLRM